MPIQLDRLRLKNMQTHSSQSQQKTNKAHVGNTGDAATDHGSTATEKRQTHAEPSAMVQAKRERLARLALWRKDAITWSNTHLLLWSFSMHSPLIMACLHLVLSPCCTARARVTKHFLHTEHCVSATKRLASPRLPCALHMCVRNAATDTKAVSHFVQICSCGHCRRHISKNCAQGSREHTQR